MHTHTHTHTCRYNVLGCLFISITNSVILFAASVLPAPLSPAVKLKPKKAFKTARGSEAPVMTTLSHTVMRFKRF